MRISPICQILADLFQINPNVEIINFAATLNNEYKDEDYESVNYLFTKINISSMHILKQEERDPDFQNSFFQMQVKVDY